MKTISTLLLSAFILACTPLFAQNHRPVEKSVQMDGQAVNAWVIAVGEVPAEDLRKDFVRYGKQQLDVRMKKRGRDMAIAKAAMVPSISPQQGDLKALFYTEEEETHLAVAFMPGYTIALNTKEHKADMDNLRKFVKHFVKSYKMEQYQKQLSNEESRKKSLESAYERNQREQKKVQRHLRKVEKQLASDKTDDARKFTLNNQQIGDKSRLDALELIMHNQKGEIMQVEQQIQASREALGQLETLFADPLTMDDQPDPQENDQ